MRNFNLKLALIFIPFLISFTLTAVADDTPKLLKTVPLGDLKLEGVYVDPSKIKSKEQTCDEYAKTTVEQFEWLSQMNCPRYANTFTTYNVVYSDCLAEKPLVMGETPFNIEDIPKLLKKRQEEIADCICRPYAENAVKQNNANIKLECGYEGGRWSSSYLHHYNWCASGGGNIISNKSWEHYKVARNQDLQKCRLPAKPSKLSPAGGITDRLLKKLSWDDHKTGKPQVADSYQLQLYQDGKLHFNREDITHNSWNNTIKLNYGAQIKWQVRGKNQYGYGDWATASFQVVNGPPKIQSFTRNPLKSYYKEGDQVELKWSVQCFQKCNISLFGGLNGNLFKKHNQPPVGSYTVTCKNKDLAYKLFVKSGSDTVYETESVRPEKQQSSLRRFYFLAKCNSTVKPCTKVHYDAVNEASAMQQALKEFSNCKVEKVEFSDWHCN